MQVDPYHTERNLYAARPTHKETYWYIHVDAYTDLHAGRSTHRDTCIQVDPYTERPTCREAHTQRDIYAGRPIYRETCMQVDPHTERPTCR